jgi:hypothetical protein
VRLYLTAGWATPLAAAQSPYTGTATATIGGTTIPRTDRRYLAWNFSKKQIPPADVLD